MSHSMHPSNRRRWLAGVLGPGAGLIICVLLVGTLHRPAPLDPLLVLARPMVLPVPLRDRFIGWVPRRWLWAQRLADTLLGPRKPVNLNSAVFTVSGLSVAELKELAGDGPAHSAGNGPTVWFLDSADLKKVRARLQTRGAQVCYGRISSADGITAGLFMGQSMVVGGLTNQVGLQSTYFARVGPEATDLFTQILFSEAVTNDFGNGGKAAPSIFVRTNADIAVRLQVPKGKGVFLLQAAVGDKADTQAGLVLDPL